MPAPDAYHALRDELSKTSVISADFRSVIMSYASAIDRESFAAGKEQGVSEAAARRTLSALTPWEEQFLVEAGKMDNATLEQRIEALGHDLSNVLDGERVSALDGHMLRLSAALLIRARRRGVFGSDRL